MGKIILKKKVYESAKIAVKKGALYGDEEILRLANYSFDEILKYMEEHGFKDSIDVSYLQFEGFYLIERILNIHVSKIYKDVFYAANQKNKILFEVYYLKYQIHNLMVLVRCYLSKEDNIEPFLIGDERRKEKYIKAFSMPKIEDAILYISKKLGIDSVKSLEAYKKGVYELENYLYKVYYEKLKSFKFIFNGVEEKKFFKFIREYIDLINARTFMKFKTDNIDFDSFEKFYIEGGLLKLNFFEKSFSKSINECLLDFNTVFGDIENCDDVSFVASIDKRINVHKASARDVFKSAKFGSPFFTLKYLFDVEREMSKLRILLKAKYLKMDDKEIKELIK